MTSDHTVPPLRIALLGTRGIPAAYGGFETFAEELSTRLVSRGHQVTVYGRHPFGAKSVDTRPLRGVQRRSTPTVMHKYLETPLHALTSFIDVIRREADVVLLCNAANSPFAWIARLAGLPVVVNVDGIERMRSKWNSLGKLWYRFGERCSVWFASTIVADAEVIAAYYRARYGCASEIIAYGADPRPLPAGATLRELQVEPGRYLLYVSRLEPENNALGVIQAYGALNTEIPLVVVGDAPYAKEYIARCRAAACANVRFAGFRFGEAYRELRSNCLAYVQATEVGGTHPALVEAMAYGNCIVANDVPEHREVLADAGLYYSKNDFQALSIQLARVLEDEALRGSLAAAAQARAAHLFRWEHITEQYERVLSAAARKDDRESSAASMG